MKYIAFIRGINVGGSNVMKMDKLRKLFSDIGFNNVQTYIQSGNVFFDSDIDDSGKIEKIIETELSDYLNNKVTVFAREYSYLSQLAAKEPFDLKSDEDIKFYIVFLKNEPEQLPGLPLISEKDGLELIKTDGRELYLISRRIKGRYGFPNNFIENKFSVAATSRNWKTFLKMMDKFAS